MLSCKYRRFRAIKIIKSFLYKITSFLICSKVIKDEESDLYLNEFQILIAFIVNMIVILFMAYVF
ncbi:hypothetical protein C4Z57_00570 [Clostridioides difficile]|nr:hypothetical protein [Clostridioides difficile]EQJ64785.1 hypothetical protein QU3_3799 [Clostridioides difficile P42]EQK84335.1 hypothetical protein QSM_3810 [Clostridioides difficile P30]EGT4168865.1 hypothetical protein [Clostridioides difficile]EGT4203789.1 hypothetical protein [Clostridioides difficile]